MPTIGRLAAPLLTIVLSVSGLLAATPLAVVASSPDGLSVPHDGSSPVEAPGVTFSRPTLSGPEPQSVESEPLRLRPRPGPGPFSMNLYTEGDSVHQRTIYWCVAASVQTMINIMEEGQPDRSKRSQRRIHFEARSLDPGHAAYWRNLDSDSPLKRGLHGLGLVHWVWMLDAVGYGPYQIDRAETLKRSIRMAAKAIRLTGKPAGLVVWKGAHAWVMSGFKATADPAYSNDFKVTEAYVSDPWYPDVSSNWGVSRPPNSAVPVSALGEDYLPYDRPGRVHPKRDGLYMLILPTLPPVTPAPSSSSGRVAVAPVP